MSVAEQRDLLKAEEHEMISRFGLMAVAVVALAHLTSSAEAGEMAPLKIAKECSEYTAKTPSFCTITDSNVAGIPAGTKVLYYGPVTGSPLFTSSSVVVAAGAGDSAVGYCIVYDTAKPPLGMCAFHAGSGKLAGFQAIAKVTVDDKQIWHWEGGYLFEVPK
jgi:hypothetical protein